QSLSDRGAEEYGKCRRKQYRQWTAQAPVVTINTRPEYFCNSPGWSVAGRSPTGSAVNPGVLVVSASSGNTCRTSGSLASPRRIRARKGRGTNSGNWRHALAACSATSAGSPSNRQSSSTSRTASFITRCQVAAVDGLVEVADETREFEIINQQDNRFHLK